MSLEEFLVDRDVLDRDDAPPRLVLGDRVDQRRRIAIAEPIEDGREVYRHGPAVYQECR
jgi:hypothetical protein